MNGAAFGLPFFFIIILDFNYFASICRFYSVRSLFRISKEAMLVALIHHKRHQIRVRLELHSQSKLCIMLICWRRCFCFHRTFRLIAWSYLGHKKKFHILLPSSSHTMDRFSHSIDSHHNSHFSLSCDQRIHLFHRELEIFPNWKTKFENSSQH